jgi:hypothetical protein
MRIECRLNLPFFGPGENCSDVQVEQRTHPQTTGKPMKIVTLPD